MPIGYAITDGLVAITGLAGFYQLIRQSQLGAKLAAWCLFTMGIAATIGTIKFAFDLNLLQPVHAGLSSFSASVGMFALAGGFLSFIAPNLTQRFSVVQILLIATIVYTTSKVTGVAPLTSTIIGGIANLIGLYLALKLLQRKQTTTALLLLASCLILVANGLLIGSSEKLILGFPAFYWFHCILAGWISIIGYLFYSRLYQER